jgi:peptidyl-dipeptidase A
LTGTTDAKVDSPERIGSFLAEAENELLELAIEASRGDWVYATYISPDTEDLSARATARLLRGFALRARSAQALPVQRASPEEQRKILLLRLGTPLAAPRDALRTRELSQLVQSLQGIYARGRYAPRGSSGALDLQGLSRILEESHDPSQLQDVWEGWHRVGREMRPGFQRYVELANEGARDNGFADLGSLWRSRYDMTPEEFSKEVERLWRGVRPLYQLLHAFVRRRLAEHYGERWVDPKGPIPNHLLGNMWAQSWEALYPLLVPPGSLQVHPFDLSRVLQERHTTPERMARYAEGFFTSLGLPALPSTFWERSMLSRPRDREVVCHASAYQVDLAEDIRIKMCVDITAEDFHTLHHELGHNYYQWAYAHQPFLFRDSAQDGFHEALGDTIDLSVTPSYLAQVGLLPTDAEVPDDLNWLLRQALTKVAFLPFGLLVDRWRWDVFSGEIPPESYNATWWKARREYQGVAPPSARSEADFDPGAKYHVPASVPYMRYFLAYILQFQFHRALVRVAGAPGPLHLASIYGSREAGQRLWSMMQMGQSRPWPDALEALTGSRQMDPSALLEYFAPLESWLRDQLRGQTIGW